MATLVSNTVWHCGRLIKARSRLVVATRSHTQLSSFWFRISSNTPSCSKESHEWNTFANPKGTCFPFCKPGLRNSWTNGHSTRLDRNLEELINQINRPSNKLHPRSTTMIAWTQKSRGSLPTYRSVFFLDKERWHLGEGVLRVREVSLQDSIWAWLNQREVAPQTRCSLIANMVWDAQGGPNGWGVR
jgi:hypothetical protein